MPRARLLMMIALCGACASAAPERMAASSRTRRTHTGRTRAARTQPARTHSAASDPDRDRARVRCDEDDLAGCHAAGLDAYYREEDTDAVAYFQRGCERDYAPSCNGLGLLYAEGRGVVRDHVQANSLFRRACDAGVSTGCFHLAQALQQGRGTPLTEHEADRARARYQCLRDADAECPD